MARNALAVLVTLLLCQPIVFAQDDEEPPEDHDMMGDEIHDDPDMMGDEMHDPDMMGDEMHDPDMMGDEMHDPDMMGDEMPDDHDMMGDEHEEDHYEPPEGMDSHEDHQDPQLSEEQLAGLHGKMDANMDGHVSYTELLSFSHRTGKEMSAKDINNILVDMDKNNDGKLTLEEYTATYRSPEEIEGDELSAEERQELQEEEAERIEADEASIANNNRMDELKFQAADLNKDGFLDETEVPAFFYPEHYEHVLSVQAEETFKQMDVNQDGKLDKNELFGIAERPEEEPEDGGEEDETFNKLDKNSDGYIDQKEYRIWESGHFHIEEQLLRLMEAADSDNDGKISSQELLENAPNMRETDAHYDMLGWVEHYEL